MPHNSHCLLVEATAAATGRPADYTICLTQASGRMSSNSLSGRTDMSDGRGERWRNIKILNQGRSRYRAMNNISIGRHLSTRAI